MKNVFKLACGAEIKILRINADGVTIMISDVQDFAVVGEKLSEKKACNQIELYFGWKAVPGLQKAFKAILDERKNLPAWARHFGEDTSE